jgi:hypothetical protein
MRTRLLWRVVWLGLTALTLAQLVPYGRSHLNPPLLRPAQWDSQATEQLARRACFDCHSHETRWPWYANVAPASWRVQHDVGEGREHLNFSALTAHNERSADAIHEAGETVTGKQMPPWDYLLLHPAARLTDAERVALAAGLGRTLAASGFAATLARPGEVERVRDEERR